MPCPDPTRGCAPKPTSTALRCLLHPAGLLALALLGLNDHLWKGAGPGWLTGKLSDFAGLFYFPFLVILLLGLILPSDKRKEGRGLARGVFWGVGIWFAAAKSIPVVHRATVALAEVFLGKIQVVMDPSDCLAIVALIPSWLLYRHVASLPPRTVARAAKPAIVGLTLLLTTATSRRFEPSVQSLVVHDNQLYALVGDDFFIGEGFDTDTHRYQNAKIYTTLDGKSWTLAELPDDVLENHKRQKRVKRGHELLELEGRRVVSSSGAHHWSISRNRQEFMQAAGARPWETFDIAALPGTPDTIVVALRSEGIVVLDGQGTWTRHSVGDAAPTPLQVSVRESLEYVAISHWIFGAAAAMITWILVSLLVWRGHREEDVPVAKVKTARVGMGTRTRLFFQGMRHTYAAALSGKGYLLRTSASIALPLLLFLIHLEPIAIEGGFALPIFAVLSVVVLGASLLVIAFSWRKFNKKAQRQTKTTYFAASLLAGALATGFLMLWDMGVVPSLSLSFALASVAIVAILSLIAGHIGSRAR